MGLLGFEGEAAVSSFVGPTTGNLGKVYRVYDRHKDQPDHIL